MATDSQLDPICSAPHPEDPEWCEPCGQYRFAVFDLAKPPTDLLFKCARCGSEDVLEQPHAKKEMTMVEIEGDVNTETPKIAEPLLPAIVLASYMEHDIGDPKTWDNALAFRVAQFGIDSFMLDSRKVHVVLGVPGSGERVIGVGISRKQLPPRTLKLIAELSEPYLWGSKPWFSKVEATTTSGSLILTPRKDHVFHKRLLVNVTGWLLEPKDANPDIAF